MTENYKEISEICPTFKFKPISTTMYRIKSDGQYTNQFTRSITYGSDEGPLPLEFTICEDTYIGDFTVLWNNVITWATQNDK